MNLPAHSPDTTFGFCRIEGKKTVVLWLIILAGAFGGGLLVLHGFSKCKAGGEQMLETYQQMLAEATKRRRDRLDGKTGDSERDDQPEDSPTNEDLRDAPQ